MSDSNQLRTKSPPIFILSKNENSVTKMSSDPLKNSVDEQLNYYLVIGHACDEESAWLYLDFEEEKTNDFLEEKFIEFVLKELGYDPDSNKEVYIDFILKSNSPIQIQ